MQLRSILATGRYAYCDRYFNPCLCLIVDWRDWDGLTHGGKPYWPNPNLGWWPTTMEWILGGWTPFWDSSLDWTPIEGIQPWTTMYGTLGWVSNHIARIVMLGFFNVFLFYVHDWFSDLCDRAVFCTCLVILDKYMMLDCDVRNARVELTIYRTKCAMIAPSIF